nr:hypothetical protein [uncultured bacterium]
MEKATRRRKTATVSAENKRLIAGAVQTLLTGKPYVNAARTDIVQTFRRFGWTPPSEARK